jgi:hypothetical protein
LVRIALEKLLSGRAGTESENPLPPSWLREEQVRSQAAVDQAVSGALTAMSSWVGVGVVHGCRRPDMLHAAKPVPRPLDIRGSRRPTVAPCCDRAVLETGGACFEGA